MSHEDSLGMGRNEYRRCRIGLEVCCVAAVVSFFTGRNREISTEYVLEDNGTGKDKNYLNLPGDVLLCTIKTSSYVE